MSDQGGMGYGEGYEQGEGGGGVTTMPTDDTEREQQAAGKNFAGRTWALLSVKVRPSSKEDADSIGQELMGGEGEDAETGGAGRGGVRRIATLLLAAGVGAAVTAARIRRQRQSRGLGRVMPRRVLVWKR